MRPVMPGCIALALFTALAACASPSPNPQVNLSAYPPEFKQGYADGCASSRGSLTRNDQRFKSDPQYASG
jgi:hypothetical protein